MASRHPKTILITAAEPSADRLGAALMAALKKKKPGVTFVGVGGAAMKAAGLKELFPQRDINVMGLVEVLPHVPVILRRIGELVAYVRAHGVDAVVTIDAQDFSARLGRALRKVDAKLPIVQYSGPTVWAWRAGRAKKLARYLTHLLTLFPFEAKYYQPYGLPVTYVGHPMVEALAGVKAKKGKGTVLALLPGSRPQEFARHWPLILAVYRELRMGVNGLSAILVLTDKGQVARCRELADWGKDEGLSVVVGEERFEAVAGATAALAKSGTNTLELALMGVPAVVCYRMAGLTHAIAKLLVRTKLVALPNIILGQEVYPEFVQGRATEQALVAALYPLLTQEKVRVRQQDKLKKLNHIMMVEDSAVDVVVALLG